MKRHFHYNPLDDIWWVYHNNLYTFNPTFFSYLTGHFLFWSINKDRHLKVVKRYNLEIHE